MWIDRAWRRDFAILISLAAVLVAPVSIWGPGFTDSGYFNYTWTHQFATALKSGTVYPRWLPGSFEGLGSPTFYFYPPIAYWLSGALELAGLTTRDAINAASGVLLLASGVTMHVWLRHRGTRPLLGAALYMAAPYHLVEIYRRGALAELAAFVWLPLLALAIDLLPRRSAVALLALACAGLMLSHLPTALLATLFLLVPMAFARALTAPRVVSSGLAGAVLGSGLAAAYLLPALTLQRHVSMELLWTTEFNVRRWTVWTSQDLLYWFTKVGPAVAAVLLAMSRRTIFGPIAVVSAAMALGLLPWFWQTPGLDLVQFPWRLLSIVEFAAITALVARPPRLSALVAAGTLVLLSYAFTGKAALQAWKIGIDEAAALRTLHDAPEYLPAGLIPRQVTRVEAAEYLPHGLPRGDVIRVDHPGPVTIHRADFPIWRVTKDGRTIPHHGPVITFEATPGVYRIERVRLWSETTGAIISALAALGLLGLLLVGQRPKLSAPSYPMRIRG